jgi:hypothetical protein
MAKANNPMLKRTAPRPAEPTTVDVIEDTDITHDLLSELPPDCSLEKPLSTSEKKRLVQLEDFVGKNFKTFYYVGCALREICDQRLYRETHTNFADYSKDKWDLARSRSYQMIEAANVVDNIVVTIDEKDIENLEDSEKCPPMVDTFFEAREFKNVAHGRQSNIVANWRHSNLIPQNERQARTLAKYPPETQREIWATALKTADNGRITAAHIRKTASSQGLKKVKKAVKQARKPKKRGAGGPKMSPAFKTAYHAFLDAINVEREAEWQHTDPKPAIQAVKVILQALEAEL